MAEQSKENVGISEDLNEILRVRREKLADLIENGKNPYEITKFNKKESAKPTQADRNLRQKISAITAFAIGGSAAICAVLALILGGQ